MKEDIFKEKINLSERKYFQNKSFFESSEFFRVLNKFVNSSLIEFSCQDLGKYNILSENDFYNFFDSIKQCHNIKTMTNEFNSVTEIIDYFGIEFII